MDSSNKHRHALWQRYRISSISLPFFISILLLLVLTISSLVAYTSPQAQASSNTLNFQGRLLTNTGGLVPDGVYNVEFNLYNVSTAGSTLWTEDRLNTNTEGVTIRNGYFSVYLGEYDTLSGVDWNQDLWLGMTIRGTGNCAWGACTPADSEMTPRFALSAVPYAYRAANVGSSDVDSTDSNDVTIQSGDSTTSGTTGDIIIDTGSGATANGGITLGATNASSIILGNSTTNPNFTFQGSGSFTIDSLDCTSNTNGGALTADGSGVISCSDDEGGGGGSSLFTDGGTFTYLTATADDLVIGANNVAGASLFVDVSAGSTTFGNSSLAGSLVVSDGSSSTVTFRSATQVAATNYDITVPAITGNDTVCLVTLANCSGSGVSDLQGAYAGGNTISATDANGDIDLTVTEATNFTIDIAGTGSFEVQDGGTAVLGIADGGALTVQNFTDSTSGFQILDKDGGTPIVNVDTTNERVGIGTATPSATLDVVAPTPTTIGSELVTNGSFTGSAAGWSLESSCSVYGTNNVVVTYDAGCQGDASYPALRTDIATTAGSTYRVTFTLSGVSGDKAYIYLYNSNYYQSGGYGNGTHTHYFTTDFTGTETIEFDSYWYVNNATWTIDDVSIVEVSQPETVLEVVGSDGARTLSVGDISTKNIAIGAYANTSNTTGTNNVAIGSDSLYSNTTGTTNNAVGTGALYSNTSGGSNNAFGSGALHFNTTGILNNAFGSGALKGNTTGSSNNVLGSAALFTNTTGSSNVAIGRNTAFRNSTGSNNVYLGREAAAGAFGGVDDSSNNVFLGYRSGYVVDDADNNILIGYQAGDNITDGDNNIIIGYDLDASSATVSNELRIGGILQGSTSTLAAQFNGTLSVADKTAIGSEASLTDCGAVFGGYTNGQDDCQLSVATDITSVTGGAGFVSAIEVNPSGPVTTSNYDYYTAGVLDARIPATNSEDGIYVLNSLSLRADNQGSGNVDWIEGIESFIYNSGAGNAEYLYGYYNYVANTGGGTAARAVSTQNYVENYNAGSVVTEGYGTRNGLTNYIGTSTNFTATNNNVAADTTGSITTAIGTDTTISNFGTGTITTGYGSIIRSAVNSGGGTFLNNYGVYIEDQSAVGSTNSYNLYSAGATAANYIQGTLEVDGLAAFDGGLTIEAGDTLTFNGEGFTDLTGTGLNNNSGVLEATLGAAIETGEITDDTILAEDLSTVDTLGAGVDGYVYTFNNTSGNFDLVDASVIGGSGGVTSVGVSGGTTGLTTTGGPITSAGTITLQGTLAITNGGTGATTEAGARTNLGLAIGTDVQAYNANTTVLGSSINLNTAEVAGTLPVTRGGTGATTFTAGGILYGNGVSAVGSSVAGTAGQCLISGGAGAPTWSNCAPGAGVTLFTLAGSSGTPQSIATGNTVTIAAGSNLTSTAGATDTVTLTVVSNPTFSGLVSATGAGTGLTVTNNATIGGTLTLSGTSFNLNGTNFTESDLDALDNGTITLGSETTGTYDSTPDTIADDGFIQGSEITDGTVVLGTDTSGAYDTTNDSVVGTVDTGEITNGTITEPDLNITNAATDNYILTANTGGSNFTWVNPATILGAGVDSLEGLTGALTLTGNSQISVSPSGSDIALAIQNNSIGDTQLAFDTGQNLTTTSDVTFRSATLTRSSIVDGSLNQIQFTVQGNTIQSGDIFVVENSAGDDFFTVDSNGRTSIDRGNLLIDGFYNEVQLTVQGNGIQSGDIFVVENSVGTDLFTVDVNGNGFFDSGDLTVSGGNLILGATNLSETDLDALDDGIIDISSETNLVAGTGAALAGDTINVGGGTCITSNANDVAITGNCIDDAQIADNSIDATSLATNSVDSAEIAAGAVDEIDLNVTNAETSGYVLSSNGAGAFTWIVDDTGTDTTYSAGNDLDLSGTTFNIESQLDFVSVINRTSADLTLQTTTSGNILVNPAGDFNVDSNTLFVDSSADRVGIGTATPSATLEVVGTVRNDNYANLLDVIATSTSVNLNQNAATGFLTVSPTAPSTASYAGLTGFTFSSDTDVTNSVLIGVSAQAEYQGTGTANDLRAFSSNIGSVNGTVARGVGYYAPNPFAYSGGVITNNYGVLIADQTRGTNDYGIAIEGADTQALWIGSGANNTNAANGLAFGSSRDTNLYRSAANTLRTDDALSVGGALTVTGTTNLNGGDINIGNGTGDNVSFTARVDSNIIPDADDTYNLGSSTLRWQDLYLGPNSLNIGTNANNGTVSYNTTESRLEVSTLLYAPDGVEVDVSGASPRVLISSDNSAVLSTMATGWPTSAADTQSFFATEGTNSSDYLIGAYDNSGGSFNGINKTGAYGGYIGLSFDTKLNTLGGTAAGTGAQWYDGNVQFYGYGDKYAEFSDDGLEIYEQYNDTNLVSVISNRAAGDSYVPGNFGLGSSAYLNFGATRGVTGYGIRDNGGTIEFKNSGGAWAAPGGGVSGSGAANRIALWGGTSSLTSNSNLYYDANYNIGIGTSNPAQIGASFSYPTTGSSAARVLNVKGAGDQRARLVLESGATATGGGGGIQFYSTTAAADEKWIALNQLANGDLAVQSITDAGAFGASLLTIDRTDGTLAVLPDNGGEGIRIQPYDTASRAAISVRNNVGGYVSEWRSTGEFRTRDDGIGFSFLSDSDTGLGRTGTNALALYTANVARLSVSSAGLVTIPGGLEMSNSNITGVNAISINDVGASEGLIFISGASQIDVAPLGGGNSDGYMRLINDGGVTFQTSANSSEWLLMPGGYMAQDVVSGTYDVWIQGRADGSTSGGDSRNLALLGQTSTDTLRINFNNEYSGGTTIESNLVVSGTLRVNAKICDNGVPGFFDGTGLQLNASSNDGFCYVSTSATRWYEAAEPGLTNNAGANVIAVGCPTGGCENNGVRYNLVVYGTSGTTCTVGNGTGTTSCSSDSRKKNNITSYGSNLSKINQLNPVKYYWNEDVTNTQRLGLIAQEVINYYPELVTVDDEGFYALDYSAFVGPLIGATQEIDLKVENNSSRLDTAEQTLAVLNSTTTNLTKRNITVTNQTTTNKLVVTGTATIANLKVTGLTELADLKVNGKIITSGDAPVAQVGTTLTTVLGASVTNDGTDTAGTVVIESGTQASVAGEIADIEFTESYSVEPKIVISGNNSDSAKLGAYVVRTIDGFKIMVDDPLDINTEYSFDYIVIEAQN